MKTPMTAICAYESPSRSELALVRFFELALVRFFDKIVSTIDADSDS